MLPPVTDEIRESWNHDSHIMGSIMKCIMQTLWNLEHDGFGTKNIFDLLKVFNFIPQMVVKHGDLPWLNP